MSLIKQNFNLAAQLNELAAVKIQSMLRLLADNTDTMIKLEQPEKGAMAISFELVSGSFEVLDEVCAYKNIQRQQNRLEA